MLNITFITNLKNCIEEKNLINCEAGCQCDYDF